MSTEFNADVVKKQIIDFMTGFTIETTPGSAAKTPDYREHLRPGTEIAVTFLPGSDFADTVSTSKRLKAEGFVPMPHFAARSIPSLADFENYLITLQGEVGIEHAVALGGAVDKPLGQFESSMQLLETGLFDKHGIKSIGVAGHPEGSPDISTAGLQEALSWKNSFKERSDAYIYIATQFCFEAEPIIAWDKKIQAEGNKLPIHIGVPGLATLKTLLNHAKACGVGASMRVLTKQARNIAKLMTVNAPDKLVMDLARYHAEDPNCGIQKVHMYPLGGMKKSAAWSYAVTDGDFTLDAKGKGFKVNRDIG
ncbi:methylenetetrahydrofolate reductase [Kiloniella laminariae]|uniref:methylenetetrahydrofolate reductase n=1 Tax=Kiloniella laminariae TaxID=454162 RepID=UPI000381CA2A|nr:methylenetetrahydrofolate reductase [Kiloniella laminariae]